MFIRSISLKDPLLSWLLVNLMKLQCPSSVRLIGLFYLPLPQLQWAIMFLSCQSNACILRTSGTSLAFSHQSPQRRLSRVCVLGVMQHSKGDAPGIKGSVGLLQSSRLCICDHLAGMFSVKFSCLCGRRHWPLGQSAADLFGLFAKHLMERLKRMSFKERSYLLAHLTTMTTCLLSLEFAWH